MNPLELVRKNILALTPYSTARDEYRGPLGVFLDANENPYQSGYNRYPDPAQRELKEVLAGIKGVPAEQIFVGNGSDEAIDLCFRVFCEPRFDNAIAITPSYGMYRVAAAINDVEMREVRLRADFSLDTEAILAQVDSHTKLLFLCSPNNPSGNLLERSEIERLLEQFGEMVVIDEAYIDFADDAGFLPEIDRYPNLIVLQTLSKAWGLAGLRLGLAFGSREVMDIFARVKYPYNIGVATQRLVLNKLRDVGEVERQIAEIKSQRARVAEALRANPAVTEVFPSDANFVLVRTADPRRMYETLIAQGVIVRDRSRIAGCEGCLRITVGTPAENDKLIEILSTYR
jgi:histidinol-phosphate aminotransferase